MASIFSPSFNDQKTDVIVFDPSSTVPVNQDSLEIYLKQSVTNLRVDLDFGFKFNKLGH